MGGRRKLYLLTDGFPFGRGEKTFVGPEVERLSASFDLHIVSNTADDCDMSPSVTSDVPEGVSVTLVEPPKRSQIIRFLPRIFTTKAGRSEVKRIFASRELIPQRIVDSAFYLATAYYYHAFYLRAGILQDEDALYYCYWGAPYCLALAVAKASIQPNMSLICRLNGYDLYNERTRYGRQQFQLEKKHASDKILFDAQFNARYYEDAFGKEEKPGQYFVARMGATKPARIPQKSESDTFVLLSVAALIELKRVDLIAEALAELNDPRILWVHFGDGPEASRIEQYAKDNGINASFHGAVSYEEIRSFYESTYVDCFITTSETEGCPVSVQEALAYGIPVIGTRVGGIPEEVDTNGILLDANPSAHEVAAAITSIMDLSDDSILQMRERSLEIWKSRYNLASNLEALFDTIDSV